jgi:hypothetical protein
VRATAQLQKRRVTSRSQCFSETLGRFALTFREKGREDTQEMSCSSSSTSTAYCHQEGSQSLMQNEEAAIRKLVDTWLAASQTGDLATVLSLMADDVIFMVPGKQPFWKKRIRGKVMKNERCEDGVNQ